VIHLTSPPRARLAVLLLCSLSLLACNADPTTENAADGTSVGVAPRIPTVSVSAGTPVAFSVTDAAGSAIAWSALNAVDDRSDAPIIDSSGLFRATGAGRFLVLATRGDEHALAYVSVTEGTATDAVPVTLSFAAPRSASLPKRMNLSLSEFWIESSPDTLHLAPGSATRLAVIGRSADGSRWNIRPEWKATAGSVSDSGDFTAPTAEGRYAVIVTRQGDIQTDTSIVIVGAGSGDSISAPTPAAPTVDTPVPSVPAVTTACTNEPAGYRRVIDAPWNQLPALNPQMSSEGFTYFAGQNATLSLEQDPSAPASAASVLRVLYPKGFVGGYGPSKFSTGNLRPNAGNLYVCFWFKVSPNWTTMGHTITKFFFVMQEGSGMAHAVIAHGQDDHMYLKSLLQFADDRMNYNLGENFTAANDIGGGAWHKVEVLWEANTPGVRNGGFRQWVDGQLTGSDQSAYWFVAGLQPYWDSMWFEPTFGTPNNIVPADQSWYLDQMVVSVK